MKGKAFALAFAGAALVAVPAAAAAQDKGFYVGGRFARSLNGDRPHFSHVRIRCECEKWGLSPFTCACR